MPAAANSGLANAGSCIWDKPVAAGVEDLVDSLLCDWLPIGLGEHKLVLGVQLAPPLIQVGFQLRVDVRSQNHGGPFPVGLAGLVVAGAVPDDPPALLVLEEGLPNL